MYRLLNLSTTNLSIDGANLAPHQVMKIEKITAELRYLENKKALQIKPISAIANPIINTAAKKRGRPKVFKTEQPDRDKE